MDSPVRRTVAAIGLQSVQFQCNHTNHIAILCSFAIQLQSSLVVSIGLDGMDCTSNWERLIELASRDNRWIASIVDLSCDCRADSLEIALIWSRIVYYHGFRFSLVDCLAILCTFAIQSQSSSTVLIEVDCNRIALNLQFLCNPHDCKRLCRHRQGFGWTAL